MRFTEPFPSFVPNTHNFIVRHCMTIVFYPAD